MTIDEFQILLDLNKGNEKAVLEEHCHQIYGNWLFVDSNDGQCHLFDKNGKMLDIKMLRRIPKMLRRIPRELFKADNRLKKIVIPGGVTRIGFSAFSWCHGLTSVTIPDSVTIIGRWAFDGCDGLTGVTIPDSVTSILAQAFYGCNNLKSLVFKGKTMDQVKEMHYYPWGLKDGSVIKAES